MPSTTRGSRYVGKVCLVTGGSAGIGLGIATEMVAEGGHVIICSRRQKNIDDALKILNAEKNHGGTAEGVVCHVSNKDQRLSMLKGIEAKHGRLDVLVNNVASSPGMGRLVDMEESIWDKLFDVNVKAMWLFVKECLPLLRLSKKNPNILIVSSVVGYHNLQGDNLIAGYALTKTALLGMTKLIGQELTKETPQIRCNGLAPGVIDTNFAQPLVQNPDLLKTIPMGRVGRPNEMGTTAAFICSDDASFMTAETVVAAGGVNSRL